jgi:hypothetical protein
MAASGVDLGEVESPPEEELEEASIDGESREPTADEEPAADEAIEPPAPADEVQVEAEEALRGGDGADTGPAGLPSGEGVGVPGPDQPSRSGS